MKYTATYATTAFILFFIAGWLNPAFSQNDASDNVMEQLEQKVKELNQITEEINQRSDYHFNKIKILRTQHSRLYGEFQNSAYEYEKSYLAEIISFTSCLMLKELYVYYPETGKSATEVIKLAEDIINNINDVDNTNNEVPEMIVKIIENNNAIKKTRQGLMALQAVDDLLDNLSRDEVQQIDYQSENNKMLLEYLTQSNSSLEKELEKYLDQMEQLSQTNQSNMEKILSQAHAIRLFSDRMRDNAISAFHCNSRGCLPWLFLIKLPLHACKN